MKRSCMMDGKEFFRALAYAYAALPDDADRVGLQHVTFYRDRIIGSDGMARHDGHLPEEFAEPCSITRVSARLLMLGLEYAHKVSKLMGQGFSIEHAAGKADEGSKVIAHEIRIHYGSPMPIVHPLELVDVGSHPDDFNEWVLRDAPQQPLDTVNVNLAARALRWYRAWDKDHGEMETRGGGEGESHRIDIINDGKIVATAFLRPSGANAGELFTDPLFNGVHGKSNMELDFSGDGRRAEVAMYIKVKVAGEEHQINVTGLGDPSALLKTGPCEHRQTEDDCLPCTEAAVAKAQVDKLESQPDAPKPKRRRGKPRQMDIEDGDDDAFTSLASDDAPTGGEVAASDDLH